MRMTLSSCLAFATLAACSPPASTGAGAPEEGSQSAAVTAPSAAPGQLRQGRWNKTITAMGTQTTEVECITTSDINQLASDPNSDCTSANGFQRTAEGLVFEADCTGEDGGGHIRTVMTGDLQNSYVADTTMTSSAGGPAARMQIHIEGRYEGACHGDE